MFFIQPPPYGKILSTYLNATTYDVNFSVIKICLKFKEVGETSIQVIIKVIIQSCNFISWAYVVIIIKVWEVAINPLTAKLFNCNFHPREIVSRWRDPQLQVSENYSDLTKWRLTICKYNRCLRHSRCWWMSCFNLNMFTMQYLMC